MTPDSARAARADAGMPGQRGKQPWLTERRRWCRSPSNRAFRRRAGEE